MARLTAEKRKKMPDAQFAVIQKKKKEGKMKKIKRFPIPDKEHARKALQLLPRAKGLSPSEKRAVVQKARRKLKKKEM